MKAMIGALALFCAAVFLAFSAAPDLFRDTAHRGSWHPTNEWVAEKAKCTRHTFIMSNCSVTAVNRVSPSKEKRNLSYFTFADWGGDRVEFVRSAKDPSVISLRRATEGMAGRWAFFLAAVGLIAAAAVGAAANLRGRLA